MAHIAYSLLLAVVFIPTTLFATDFTTPVVSVLDGDTIEVLHNNHAERIRLNSIDCPEKGQACGTRAKQATSALVYGKEVALQTHGIDKYGPTILLPWPYLTHPGAAGNVPPLLVSPWFLSLARPSPRSPAPLRDHVGPRPVSNFLMW